eukprot:1156484-Pelagomonas_calceolata.AAC.8
MRSGPASRPEPGARRPRGHAQPAARKHCDPGTCSGTCQAPHRCHHSSLHVVTGGGGSERGKSVMTDSEGSERGQECVRQARPQTSNLKLVV